MMGYGILNGMGYGGFMGVGGIFLVIAVVYFLFRQKNNRTSENEGPKIILSRRYANGEITKEQFQDMKKQLNDI